MVGAAAKLVMAVKAELMQAPATSGAVGVDRQRIYIAKSGGRIVVDPPVVPSSRRPVVPSSPNIVLP